MGSPTISFRRRLCAFGLRSRRRRLAFVWLLALAAGASHSLQSATADYFRNAWLYFAEEKGRAELDSSAALQAEFDRLRWQNQPWKKFLLRLYLNYTREQEWLAPQMNGVKGAVAQTNEPSIAETYRQQSKPLIRWLNLLATNPRMILLFALLLAGQPVWYFVVELTLLISCSHLCLRAENALCRRLLANLPVEDA